MKLALFTVFALVACLQGSSWMRKHTNKESDMWLNKKHMGSVSDECNAVFFRNPAGPVAAMDTVLTSEENDDGSSYMFLQTFFNHDISPCDAEDSGLAMRMYMGSSDMFDVDAPYPEGRKMDELEEDLPENGDDFKRIYRECEANAADGLHPFCGKLATGQNWESGPSNEKNGEGLNYVLKNFFNQADIMALKEDEFIEYENLSLPTHDNDEANYDRMFIPLSLQWWYTLWGECSAFMNFDFTIQINTDMNVDRTDKVQMSVIEVKNSGCKPDGFCHIIKKASAKPVFIQSKMNSVCNEDECDIDWAVAKVNNKFSQGHDLFLKYVIKNPADWAGMAMKMTQFAMTRGKRPTQYVLLVRDMETDEIEQGNPNFPIPTIIEEWNNENGEVRMSLPALEGTGKKGTYVFYGSFAIMGWDEDNDDFDGAAGADDIPEALGGRGLYMSYRENVAANKGRRRLQDDKVQVSEFSSGNMEMVDGDDAEDEAGDSSGGDSGGFFGWLMSLFSFGVVMGVAGMKLKGFYNADAQHAQFE